MAQEQPQAPAPDREIIEVPPEVAVCGEDESGPVVLWIGALVMLFYFYTTVTRIGALLAERDALAARRNASRPRGMDRRERVRRSLPRGANEYGELE